ncbi:hypothetical protein Ancab_030245 [Ancistrocladus abbreviatus]
MDHLWRSVAVKSQRALWKRKVEQIAEESESLKESLDKYFSRHQRRMLEAKERAELLGRVNGESAHVLRIFDDEAQAMQSARNSTRMMEEAYRTGVAILSKFSEQRERMKVLKLHLYKSLLNNEGILLESQKIVSPCLGVRLLNGEFGLKCLLNGELDLKCLNNGSSRNAKISYKQEISVFLAGPFFYNSGIHSSIYNTRIGKLHSIEMSWRELLIRPLN